MKEMRNARTSDGTLRTILRKDFKEQSRGMDWVHLAEDKVHWHFCSGLVIAGKKFPLHY
jgi:hypothetical protein